MPTGLNILLSALCVSFLIVRSIQGESTPEKGSVTLPNGVQLHGDQFQEGGTYVYYGIKYGLAGRFEYAKANTDFSYLNNPNRLKQGHVCPHFPLIAPDFPHRKLSMDEDCLYLDVYVPPADKESSVARPVLFWIYGGGFKMGDKDLYNSTILAKAVDSIVVTVNYRLSAFGFLSTGDEVARGNWAIGDLKLALNWTIDNIAAFGGDPKQITIFGESAGGVLTSALLLDDDVRHKVKAGVAFSGSMLAGWAVTKNPEVGTLALAGYLGCSNASSAEAVTCLKALPYEVLLNGTAALEKQKVKETLEIHYTPVVDGVHIPKLPQNILQERAAAADKSSENNTSKLITGYLREDAALFTLFARPQALWDNATHNYSSALNMLTLFTMGITSGKCPPQQAALKAKAALDFYQISQDLGSDEALNAYHLIASDLMFGLHTMKESMMYSNISDDANQMFLLSYDPGFRKLGSFHCLDVFHLFRGAFDAFLKEKTSNAVSRALHDYVRQIAYNGRYEGPYFGREGNYHELTQDAKFVNKKNDFSAKVAFLEDILNCSSSS